MAAIYYRPVSAFVERCDTLSFLEIAWSSVWSWRFPNLLLRKTKSWRRTKVSPIPKVEFDAQGELKMTASPNSSPNHFDFLVGKWKMHNRHLDKRLANCRDWTEFDSSDVNTKIVNGAADMDTSTTQFPGMGGKLFEGLTLRLFDPKTRLWSLYWIASNTERSILPSSVRSTKTARPFFWQRHAQWQTDPSSSAGMRGTKTALSGVRPFHQITARRGNGISLTSRNGPGNDELNNVSDLTLQRFNASTKLAPVFRLPFRTYRSTSVGEGSSGRALPGQLELGLP